MSSPEIRQELDTKTPFGHEPKNPERSSFQQEIDRVFDALKTSQDDENFRLGLPNGSQCRVGDTRLLETMDDGLQLISSRTGMGAISITTGTDSYGAESERLEVYFGSKNGTDLDMLSIERGPSRESAVYTQRNASGNTVNVLYSENEHRISEQSKTDGQMMLGVMGIFFKEL